MLFITVVVHLCVHQGVSDMPFIFEPLLQCDIWEIIALLLEMEINFGVINIYVFYGLLFR